MSRMPRILPLAGVAVVGVLAINVASGAKTIPDMFSGAKAWAEGVAGAPAVPPVTGAKPAPVCAPTAAELAKEAGLSPAELQILQSLGVRRGELDAQAQTIETNQQLLAAAAGKLDERVKALAQLKTDIQALLVQSDAQQKAENLRLITVYSNMKPKDAALRMSLLDDSVLVPIAAGMKERILAAIIAKMDGPVAKKLTENLARRYAAAQVIKDGQAAVAPTPIAQMATAPPPTPAPAAPALAGAKAALIPPPAAAPAAKAPVPTTEAPAATTAPKAKPPAAKKPVVRKPKPKPAAKPTTTAAVSPGPQPYKAPEKPADKPTPATTAAAGDTTKPPPLIPAK
ncbi:flagellar motility protein MotE (MotC chaperone) [Caulobacter ginsengisoli]|uniref:Flagellar motility protein MotE (MotC chaperone) n=1 Tax=Caulobacter ginsengisoli TaxID=400775 RepID=A0ABU0IK36_9CAUL|nr:MotE family protein [Caulobacter ginsengisoli]MDQ0462371.1 flagellar motility protein MotE (MotC chaperone) [Caulobacter ginsengisoli]